MLERQFRLVRRLLIRTKTSKMVEPCLLASKKYAGEKAVQEREFKGNMVIGIGSGSTIVFVVKYIAKIIEDIKAEAQRAGKKTDLNVICVPSSFQAKQLIQENNLNLGSLDTHAVVDWTIDGADEVDADNNIIKGGGACLTQEKILASCSKEFYIAADHTKFGPKLGTRWSKGIPIEVIPLSYVIVKNKIQHCFGGEAVLRMAVMKAGPLVTDNGNFILDWKFPNNISDWKQMEVAIKLIPGVVEVGLFINMATKIYIGNANGEVETYSHQINTEMS